ncbi:Calpain-type cysteine protease DEK1 [Capsicum chinense]|nr:Calpain-type cysteine protease DEK1 [Capsicum chinense]
MLKRKGRHTDRELANLLQDKGLDPNFAVMLKENGLDPMILALLQRSSLDADREHRDSNPPVTDSNGVEDVLPNHISFLEELRLQGLGKWLQRCRVMLHHVVGTPERAWLLFSLIFILETVVMAIFRPKTIKILNATHQQFEFGIAVLLLSPVVCSILAFLRSLQAEDLSMTSKPRKVPNPNRRKKLCLLQFNNQKVHNADGRPKPYDITPGKSLAFKSHNPDVCQKVQRPSLGVKKIGRSAETSDWNLGACLYGFKLLKSRVVVLFVAGTSRVFLICFGVHYWYFGHCISYAVVASVLLGASVSRHLSVTDPLAARRDTLQSTVIRLREGFRRKDQNSSASSSEGCGSSVKGSSSADAGHLGNATMPCTGDGSTWNNIEGINSDKSIDSGRPSLALCSSSCRSVVQETEVESSYVDRNLEHNSSLVVCSSSGLESQGGDSSTSTSANQ